MERSLESPVVVDVGSHTIKAGLSVNFPSDREPSVVRERRCDLVG